MSTNRESKQNCPGVLRCTMNLNLEMSEPSGAVRLLSPGSSGLTGDGSSGAIIAAVSDLVPSVVRPAVRGPRGEWDAS